jgi:hypothetical protein
MNPTIRVDEDVYEALKEQAEPFVDSPNSVLRRVLGLRVTDNGARSSDTAISDAEHVAPKLGPPESKKARRRTRRQRAPKGALLPETEYELPILEILVERDGSAPTSEVLAELEPRIRERLTDLDKKRISTGELRWRNRAQFARFNLVRKGDLASDSPRGIWELTDAGRKRARTKS